MILGDLDHHPGSIEIESEDFLQPFLDLGYGQPGDEDAPHQGQTQVAGAVDATPRDAGRAAGRTGASQLGATVDVDKKDVAGADDIVEERGFLGGQEGNGDFFLLDHRRPGYGQDRPRREIGVRGATAQNKGEQKEREKGEKG
jgi:hypothetical protein